MSNHTTMPKLALSMPSSLAGPAHSERGSMEPEAAGSRTPTMFDFEEESPKVDMGNMFQNSLSSSRLAILPEHRALKPADYVLPTDSVLQNVDVASPYRAQLDAHFFNWPLDEQLAEPSSRLSNGAPPYPRLANKSWDSKPIYRPMAWGPNHSPNHFTNPRTNLTPIQSSQMVAAKMNSLTSENRDFGARHRLAATPNLKLDALEELRQYGNKQSRDQDYDSNLSSKSTSSMHVAVPEGKEPDSHRWLSTGFKEIEPKATLYVISQEKDRLELQMSMGLPDFIPNLDKGHGDLSLIVVTPSEPTFTIKDLIFSKVEAVCPLLACSFDEPNKAGQRKPSFEAGSRQLAVAFLRHIYQGTYHVRDQDNVEIVDNNLLFHSELYNMASNYQLASLKKEALLNMLRVVEFSCSNPEKPLDLCAAIRLIYTNFAKDEGPRSIIIDYCVTCFLYHELKLCFEFRDLVDAFPQFGVDLCMVNYERRFSDEGAADIVQLSYDSQAPRVETPATLAAMRDFVYQLWGPETFKDRCGYDSVTSISSTSSFTIVHRPKQHIESDDSAFDTPAVMSEAEADDDFATAKRHLTLPFHTITPSTAQVKGKGKDKDRELLEGDSDDPTCDADTEDTISHFNVKHSSRELGAESSGKRKASEPLSKKVSTLTIRQGKMRAVNSSTLNDHDNRPYASTFAADLAGKLQGHQAVQDEWHNTWETASASRAIREVEQFEISQAIRAVTEMQAREAIEAARAKNTQPKPTELGQESRGSPETIDDDDFVVL